MLILTLVIGNIIISALLIQHATRWIINFTPKYATACKLEVLVILASLVINFAFTLVSKVVDINSLKFLLSIVGGFFAHRFIAIKLITPPGVAEMGKFNAGKIVLALYVVNFLFVGVIGLFVWTLYGGFS